MSILIGIAHIAPRIVCVGIAGSKVASVHAASGDGAVSDGDECVVALQHEAMLASRTRAHVVALKGYGGATSKVNEGA